MFRFLVSFFLLALIAPASIASVWFEPSDIRLKLDIDLLSNSGKLPIASSSWPVYAPDLDRALSSIKSVEGLSQVEKRAYYRLKSRVARVRFQQNSLKPEKLFSAETSTNRNLYSGFESRAVYSDGSALSVATRQIYKSIAFQVNLARAESENRLDGSYIATTLANSVVTVGAQSRWWGPGNDTSLIWSTQSRPVFGVHLQTVDSAHSAFDWMTALGPINAQAFAGVIKDSLAETDDGVNIYAVRIEANPINSLQLAVSGLTFDDVNLSVAGDPVKQTLMAFDFRYRFSAFKQPYYLYTQTAKDITSGTELGWNFLFGLGSQARIESLQGSLHWYLETIDVTEGLFNGFSNQEQSFASNIGYGGRSLTLGSVWSADQGWALKSRVKYAKWDSESLGLNAIFDNQVLGQDVDFYSASVAGEFYWQKSFKFEPTVFYQKFSHKVDVLEDNYGLQFKFSYLY